MTINQYSRPGVYVEETLLTLKSLPWGDPAASFAAFVGRSVGGGPVGPTEIQSWQQYRTLFGGLDRRDNLSYAVYHFFANGGAECYVSRAMAIDATPATLSLNGTQTVPAPVVDVVAKSPGTWASAVGSNSRVYVTIVRHPSGRFDVIVEVGSGAYLVAREQFVDLSLNYNDSRYAPGIINSNSVGSKFISFDNLVEGDLWLDNTFNPASATKVPLTGGSDGTGAVNMVAAVEALAVLDRNLVINIPGFEDPTDLSDIVLWAEESARHFVVVDAPKPDADETAQESADAMVAHAASLPDSSYAAVYGPWLYAADPAGRSGAVRLTAPGGAVVAHYLRTDRRRGVHKAPAGVETRLNEAVGPFAAYNNAQQDEIAQGHVNLIKTLPGVGVCIMGTRTLASGYADRYIPIRRLLIALRSSLAAITRFAIFEPNDEDLWALLDDVVERHMMEWFQDDAFKGNVPAQAFFVRCDNTNNTEAETDYGVVNIEVGVALKNPAEFIVIRIGQTQAGALVTETTQEA